MKAYDCEGIELNIGDDVIYVGEPLEMYKEAKIGMIYKIINIKIQYDCISDSYQTSIIFDFHPYTIFPRWTMSGIKPHYYKKIDYSQRPTTVETKDKEREL